MVYFRRVSPLLFAGVLFVASSAYGQWVEQTIHLQPGWNAVFLEVQPYPRDCDTIFRDIPVKSVWAWNRRFTSVQFVQDPNTLLPDQPEWLTYFPPGTPESFLTTLFILQGGRAYLINLGGDQPVDLVLRGHPKIRKIDWLADSFNFVGFYLDEASPPTFAEFFGPSPAHSGQPVYRMGPSGNWVRVADPTTERMRRGEAYWVYCKGESEYQGPIGFLFDVGDSLDYGRILIEQTFTITNSAASTRTVTVEPKPSAEPPSDSEPALAGEVPLSYFKNDPANKIYDWIPLEGPLSVEVPPLGRVALRLAVRRTDMAAFTPPSGREALYQSLLKVSDSQGLRAYIPATAKDLTAKRMSGEAVAALLAGEGVPLREDGPAPPRHPRTGLWVGTVTIDAVSNPTSGSVNPTKPLPVASPFRFRLIVHVDETGQARLLQQVLQMWKKGAFIPNPEDPTSSTYILDPNNPGRAVLLTDDSLIPQFSGVALRDVKLVGRRISTAAFGFRQPIDMVGNFGAVGTTLTCTVVLDYQDPLNPFKHKYHPDHDNWDARYEHVLPEGKESFTVTRQIGLGFTASDPEGLVSAEWGDEQVGGIYTEAISGLHRSTIYVRGTFRLQHVSDVGVLNDGLE